MNQKQSVQEWQLNCFQNFCHVAVEQMWHEISFIRCCVLYVQNGPDEL